MSSPLPNHEADPLQELRGQLDAIDHQLLRTLGQRFDVCRRIAERKSELAIPMMQPGRVKVVQERAVASAQQYGYGEEFALSLYRLIVGEACRIEDELMAARSHQPLP